MRQSMALQLVMLLMLLPCKAQTSATQDGFVPASDRHIQYVGRTCVADGGCVLFSYPGTQIIASFEGTSIKMAAKAHSGYFMVQLDDGAPRKVAFMQDADTVVTLAESLPQTTHTVRVMYAVEGYELQPEFRGFILDAGCSLTDAPSLPGRRIEFIGDSMTCGYGNEDNDATHPFSYDTENHYYTYAAITARNLQAQHLVVARSGIGVYRNWGQPVEGSADALPALYGRTLHYDSLRTWDFSRYMPQVVCVNLGTNDVSQGRYDKQRLTRAYTLFIKDIRSHYPAAKIVLLSGSMLTGQSLADVRQAMDTAVESLRSQGYEDLYRFDMSPQDVSLGYGANYHPGMRQHERMASELTAFLRSLTGWQ